MRQALGKGLDALFKQSQTTGPASSGTAGAGTVRKIPLSAIKPNRFQPRRNFNDESLAELAQSIRQHGLAQPVTVVYDQQAECYELLAGERRFRACQLAGLDEIDAIVRGKMSDEEMLAVSLVENIQREDLNAIDTALAFRELVQKFSVPQAELARYCGKSRAAVSNCLRLLELEPEIQKAVQHGTITEGHARALLTVPDRAARTRLFHSVLENRYTVRQTEDACRLAAKKGAQDAGPNRHRALKSADMVAAEDKLKLSLGTKVEIRPAGKKGGTIVIHYSSPDNLNALYDRLAGE